MCNDIIIDALWNYQNKRDRMVIKEARLYAESEDHKCHKDYIELLWRQRNAGNISETISAIINGLSKSIWQQDYESKLKQFNQELLLYERKEE